ncbi:uncharacterized protein Pyn_05037 [Prunus yedoensis var. nudiflora]|uniref:CCHC-type domain-containing protein n=1 Tax=Prunus yedoensis var. nudiflora TaxID=2094558 RepID=A0A314YTT4_PRUYE|nr:uncharacterized protein Pyn_05037 [Prunus yedoensis var. nudiflora]
MEKWHHDVGPRVFATLEKLKKQSAWYNLEIKCSICKQPGHNKRKCPRINEAGSSSQVPSQRQKKTAHQGKTSSQRVTRQSRQKQASSSTQSRQKQPIISKAKKRTNHDQAPQPSHQPPQLSHQPAQPSQPSQSNQAQQPSHELAQASQFEQPSQASQFEQASEAALFEQASQSEQPNSSWPLQASPQRKVRLKSPAKRKAFLAKFKPWRY